MVRTGIMQILLLVSLVSYALAAPLSLAPRSSGRFQHEIVSLSSNRHRSRSISLDTSRTSNILLPRPQPAPPNGPPTNQTLPTRPTNSSAPALSTSSSVPPAVATEAFVASPVAATSGSLRLSLVNNLNSNDAHAYISGIDSTGRVVMVTPSGSFYYLPDTGSPVPQAITADIAIALPPTGQSLQIAIPGYVEGARVWFADGTLDFAVVSSVNGPALVEPTPFRADDPSAITSWGFVELSYVAEGGLFANLSFVDFLGLPFALELQTQSSGTQTVPGVPRDAVQQVCSKLQRQRGNAAHEWAKLCIPDANGNAFRVISPAVLLSQQPDAFPTHFRRYVNRVWEKYAKRTLTINTQTASGNVACRTNGDEIQCDGDNRGYAKPNAMDIFGCNSGPFSILESDNAVHRAVVPRLCAALNRGTFLLDGGDVQPSLPPSSYYTRRPNNVYSAVIHEVELDGRGYAFSYDDVTPSPQDGVAGIVAAPDPSLLTIHVGGM